jgi:hypothetical protein
MTDYTGPRLFGEVTDIDRRRWQIQAHAALATTLLRAQEAGLAPLHWSLGTLGQLHATVPTLGVAQATVREIYTAWADFLDLSTRRTNPGSHGTVHLSAFGDIPDRTRRRLGRPVVISADLYPADDTQAPDDQEDRS